MQETLNTREHAVIIIIQVTEHKDKYYIIHYYRIAEMVHVTVEFHVFDLSEDLWQISFLP